MDIGVINARVDKALADNRRAEWLVVSMAVAFSGAPYGIRTRVTALRVP
jgi:hypothetical protein